MVKLVLSRTALAIGLSLAISINAVFFLLAVLLFWLPRWLCGYSDWGEHEAKVSIEEEVIIKTEVNKA